MIFAAGLGTRLKPITDNIPKALVPIAGEPILGSLLKKLKKAGADKVVINIHHFPQQIRNYVLENNNFGIKIDFSDESDELLETGGGILKAEKYLDSEPFMVHNVDIISNLDFRAFWEKYFELCDRLEKSNEGQPIALLLVSERNTQRYLLFDDNMRLVGWTNIKTGEVRSPYKDLDIKNCRKYAFSGIHILNSTIFALLDHYGFSGKFSIIDFYLKVLAENPIMGAVKEDLELVDIGKLDTLRGLM